MDQEKSINELAARVKRLQNKHKRYPVILILPSESNNDLISRKVWDDIFKNAALKTCGTYINFLTDVMGIDNPPIIGAYDFKDHINWMRSETINNGPLFVTCIDPIITTWQPSLRKAFFNEYLHLEIPWKKPIVAISFLGVYYDITHEETSQGIVLDGNLQKMY